VTMYDYASLAAATKPVGNLTFNDNLQTSVYNGFDVSINARLPGGLRLFGGTTTERTIANTCDLGAYNPSNLLYCDQSVVGIPWNTQVKLSGTYPLPLWGAWSSTARFRACLAIRRPPRPTRSTRTRFIRRARATRPPRGAWWVRRSSQP
jgi:hypothetical protein